MIRELACTACPWRGPPEQVDRGLRCPCCGAEVEVRLGVESAAGSVEVLERSRPEAVERHEPRVGAVVAVNLAGSVVHQGAVAFAVVPDGMPFAGPRTPPPAPPLMEYALIISHRGQAWARGPGVSAELSRPQEDGVAMLLNLLGSLGYRCVSTITTNDRAVWTMEREQPAANRTGDTFGPEASTALATRR